VSVSHAAAREKVVHYHGLALAVPAAWPVFHLASHPRTCVRFDRHALYLGVPGADQQCPAHAVGRTEAILAAPLSAASAGASGGAAPVPVPAAARIVRPRAGLVLTATWRYAPGLIRRALGVRSLSVARPSLARTAAAAERAHAAAAVTTGLGFDPCATPSTAAMTAWKASPYRTVGVYLGGTNMACAQPNLTPSWVRTETAAGWHMIPTYVGLQAPTVSCGCATITPGRAAAQGSAAAADAVARAQAVGFGKGNPIYFDLEAYTRTSAATAIARNFLAAWTSTLHADGYLSGVYSSAASGISDLVAVYGTGYTEPDDIWIAHWNDAHTASDSYVPDADWVNARIHQYSGGTNQTYGGVTINIDGDYLNGAAASGGVLIPDGTFVQPSGTEAVYRIAGGAPLLVSSWDGFGGPQPVSVVPPSVFAALNPYPADRTFLTTAAGRIFRMAGGAALPVSSWSVFGTVEPSITIDEWDVENTSNPLAHLRPQPAAGTVVEGLPSGTFWRFTATGRVPVSATATAIPVDDTALTPFTVLPATTGGGGVGGTLSCIVPTLRHLTIRQAGAALKRSHCRLGKVSRPLHPARHHTLHVTRQSSKAASTHPAGYAVGVTVR
jgi:hypothetical protein